MNYRHIYHAGNFADIIKHLVLISVLSKLRIKDKPFAVLDCFAGIGLYDLNSDPALKTMESTDGIDKLLKMLPKSLLIPPLIEKFLEILKSTGKEGVYPGSPWIIKQMLRQQDRLIVCELHQQDYEILRKLLYHQKSIIINNLDAYKSVKAFLPFKENRGLILLDPSFEVRNEFDKLIIALQIIKQRAINICTIIWYPIKEIKVVEQFYKNCQTIGFKEVIKIEFKLTDFSKNMNNCGLLIFNPPHIKEEIFQILKYLTVNIYNNARWKVENLINIP